MYKGLEVYIYVILSSLSSFSIVCFFSWFFAYMCAPLQKGQKGQKKPESHGALRLQSFLMRPEMRPEIGAEDRKGRFCRTGRNIRSGGSVCLTANNPQPKRWQYESSNSCLETTTDCGDCRAAGGQPKSLTSPRLLIA